MKWAIWARRAAFGGMLAACSVAFAFAVLNVPTETTVESAAPEQTDATASFLPPMDRALERVTKKPFGIEILKGHSPVVNDRFSGYHVGVDFETFPEERGADVAVTAICDGPVILKTWANGYGGVLVQRCVLDGSDVHVLYGHIDVETATWTEGEQIAQGDTVALLGEGGTEETDGVRKHLHLGVHAGPELDIRGYVQDEAEISGWLDVLEYL